ncbi:hypothetical protein LTR56_017617 [Elasticomyces elasticus]|nr:hypothetical protein LTR22_026098 [Elasticomyces elasticus]KAK3630203.1 hypothetical protein LTR56_017617 [Elasticomyces elasticus]KAK4903986.1 hypothetical protein LTR49_026488 [Elasticomyces elasticus]KAK5757766.1 hypothetical protein LTS12_012084 [Elasticomyces elasticus]
MADGIALLCMLYPESASKQERCLGLLQTNAREYYRQPSAKCTTWSYFQPLKPGKQPVIGGLEIYTSKVALQAQVNDLVYFQPYHETVKREGLYSKPEELVAWYQTAGFVARGKGGKEGEDVLISTTRMECKDRQKVLDVLQGFVLWVEENEPGVLTYAIFTRPKAANEVLLFVRYADRKVLKAHAEAPEHVEVVKALAAQQKSNTTQLWKEVQDSFVSNIEGGNGVHSKL